MTCAICQTNDGTIKLPHMTVCAECAALVQAEADRRLHLVIDALERASAEEMGEVA